MALPSLAEDHPHTHLRPMFAEPPCTASPLLHPALLAVAGSFGGPLAPQPEGGLAATLARLVDAQLGSSQADLTLFFPLGALDPGLDWGVHSSSGLCSRGHACAWAVSDVCASA